MSLRSTTIALGALCLFAASHSTAHAQASDQIIYDDSLENGWQNYGWATLNYANVAAAQTGSASISVTAGAYQSLYVHHTAIDSSNYTALTFWINGGAVGGQKITVYGTLNGSQRTGVVLAPLTANTWTQVTIPLSTLAVDGKLTLDGFWFSNQTGSSIPTFYVDNIGLVGSNTPPRTDATLTVDASTPVRTLDPRLSGVNTAVWDGNLGVASTKNALTSVNNAVLRFPGGSTSDGYNWSTGKSDGGSNRWVSTFPIFAKLAEATGAQSYITVNYGSGTPQMAAAWVAYANGAATNTMSIGVDNQSKDWKTVGYWAAMRGAAPLTTDDGFNFLRISHPTPFSIKYWEIGNECFGSWENDQHGVAHSNLSGTAHDGYTYATFAAQFLTKMHAVDPNIKVGIVAYPAQDAYANASRSAVNPNENNAIHHGWTPVVLAYLKSVHNFPEFLIHHRYAQSPGGESDDGLLLGASGWASDAAVLRKLLTDYVGSGSGSIELAATEANSVSSSPGKQSVSLVNGLFYADDLANFAGTEFNTRLWWNLHNASETNHNNNAALYGWRIFGDYGVLSTGDRADNPTNTPYPTFRAMELMTHWGRGGDSVVTASSDYNKLPIYAALLKDGRLALLVINKSSASTLTGHINLGTFPVGSAPAEVYQYGQAEDIANSDLTFSNLSVPGPAFDDTFPAYSMTVIVIPTTAAPPASQVTQILTPVNDTYASATDAAKHGAETTLGVTRTATTRWTTYLKFDLTGITKPVASAQLKMTIVSATSGTMAPLTVYGISDNAWTDSTLSFASAVAGGGLTTDSLSTGVAANTAMVRSALGDYTWDLTNYLKDKYGQIVTLQVLDGSSSGIFFKFGSRESATGIPTLTVQY